MTFDRQKVEIPYSSKFLINLDNACKKEKCREILFAFDKENNINTSIYVVWDFNSAYLLMSGSNPKYRNNNAKLLLVLDSINHVSNFTKKFDFEGSMIEKIANYNNNFGAVQKPYFTISKVFKYKIPINIYKSLRKQ